MRAAFRTRAVLPVGLLCLAIGAAAPPEATAGNPGPRWERYLTPEQAGWSGERLREIFDGSGAAALLVVHQGKVVVDLGATERRIPCASVRKSLLSALYGIHVARGDIDLDATLGDLRIEELTPLTELERRARVRDLLAARSGVYLPAGSESESMRRGRPDRGSHEPGSFWYYNNWDFNVLGTIFERATGTSLFAEFHRRLAVPLEMEHFREMDGCHDYSERAVSIHPAYPFKISARDLARVGQLYLQRGAWNGTQVVPEAWIRDSTAVHSTLVDQGPGYGGYGYLWWIDPDFDGAQAYFASGHGGHYLGVFPEHEVVIVIRPDWYAGGAVPDRHRVLEEIFAARHLEPSPEPSLVVLPSTPPVEGVQLDGATRRRYVGAHSGQYVDLYGTQEPEPGRTRFFIVERDGGLVLEQLPYFYRYRLIPLSATRFLVEDLGLLLVFELDETGSPGSPVFHPGEWAEALYRTFVDGGAEAGEAELGRLGEKAGSEFGLEYLAHNLRLAGLADESVMVLEHRMLRHPRSARAHRDFIGGFLESGDLQGLAAVYAAARRRSAGSVADPGYIPWFEEWVRARAHPVQVTDAVRSRVVGDYGPRHVVARDGGLVYFRGDRATVTEYPLLQVSDEVFVLDGLDFFRLRFVPGADGRATAVVGTYLTGEEQESPRSEEPGT